MAQIEVEPVRARGAHVSMQVLDGEFRPFAAKEVTILLSKPAAGIEPVRRDAASVGTPNWRIDDLRVPVGGRWTLRVEILISDFEKEILEDDVLLRARQPDRIVSASLAQIHSDPTARSQPDANQSFFIALPRAACCCRARRRGRGTPRASGCGSRRR